MYQIIPTIDSRPSAVARRTKHKIGKLLALFALILLGMISAGLAQDAAKKPERSLMTYKFRVARPTDNMKEVLRFYRDGLGLEVLFSFDDLGYEGQILGRRGGPYHLEFLHQRGRKFSKAPTKTISRFSICRKRNGKARLSGCRSTVTSRSNRIILIGTKN